MVSFEDNLLRLLALKDSLHAFYNTYRKDLINIHYVTQLEQKSRQVKALCTQIEQVQTQDTQKTL